MHKFLLIFLTLSMFVACKKDDDSVSDPIQTPEQIPTKTFYAIVGGAEFVETNVTRSASGGVIEIKAFGPNNSYLRLRIPQSITAGQFNFQSPVSGTRAAFYHDGSSVYGAPDQTGILKIYSHTPSSSGNGGTIKGFFNFNAEPYSASSGLENYLVTNGEFVLTY
jgi:hypothetical protein